MSINSKLRKEGIKSANRLDALQVNTIAINVSKKLCDAFPEHGFDSSKLFELISRLTMYTAQMPDDSSGAKYVFKNNSIYFNENLDVEEMSHVAIHECLHCIQHFFSTNKNRFILGLHDTYSNFGQALNEATVQLMASEANKCKKTSETYFGISIKTISPNYYPLECTLVRELTYFTGTYPLYYSALYSNDIFKNTFIVKAGKKTYDTIVKNLDTLLKLESDLNYFVMELQYADKAGDIKFLNGVINKSKEEISNIFYKTQNLIIEKCFKNEFNNIHNAKDLTSFNKKLYGFKNIMGFSDEYTYFNEFYRDIMEMVQQKQTYIEKYGQINLFQELNTSLMLVDDKKDLFYFVNKFITKVKKLVKLNKDTEDSWDFWK